jgi:hypothetical protein
MTRGFKAALVLVSRDPDLTLSDQAHLKRWEADGWPNDPLWERIAGAARAYGMLPNHSIHSTVIRESLLARRHAESVKHGYDPDLRERQKQQEYLLELATKADELAKYYEWAEAYSGIANFFSRFLMPVQELRDFHRKEAQLLRQRAGRKPKPIVRVSRQDRSKNRRGLRKLNAFIHLMDYFLREEICGQPDHHAVAVLTDIAVPGYDVDAEYVRKALLPTTAAARRKSRALDDKKS